ncbi:MAG: right-handed parallel beta-helix repeat-containing protein [Polyangiaceae bacterium]
MMALSWGALTFGACADEPPSDRATPTDPAIDDLSEAARGRRRLDGGTRDASNTPTADAASVDAASVDAGNVASDAAPTPTPTPTSTGTPPPPPTPFAGKTFNASSCNADAVDAAMAQASDGDRVLVPAGTCTWSRAVVVTKSLYLTGAGAAAGGTKIVYGGSDTCSSSRRRRQDRTGRHLGVSLQRRRLELLERDRAPVRRPEGWKNFRVHHNVFENNTQWSIKGTSSVAGLIDHNTFRGTADGIMLYGDGAADWAATLTLGTSDFFFVEDNVFEFNDDYGSTKHPVMDMDDGGRQVFRHNVIKNGLWETHDKARSGLVSANAYEIYSNQWTVSSNQWKSIDISAGTGVVWGNTFAGDISIAIGGMDYKSFDPRSVRLCDGTDPADQNVPGESGWRCQYQIGSMGEGATAYGYPLYLWSNAHDGAATSMVCTDGCNHVKAGRDFIDNGAQAKAGYVPYTYPHPLAQ